MCYSPLKFGSGSSSVEVSVWLSWKDVSLVTPTLPEPQSGGPSISEREENAGSVSKALRIVSSAAGSLSSIPSLTAFMTPASWVTNALAGAAASLGWSKPIVT